MFTCLEVLCRRKSCKKKAKKEKKGIDFYTDFHLNPASLLRQNTVHSNFSFCTSKNNFHFGEKKSSEKACNLEKELVVKSTLVLA